MPVVGHAQLLAEQAEFVGAESALVFASGYAANLGVVTALSDRDTLIDAAIASVDDDMAFCDVLTQCLETEE